MIRTSLIHRTFVCATKVAQDRHSPISQAWQPLPNYSKKMKAGDLDFFPRDIGLHMGEERIYERARSV